MEGVLDRIRARARRAPMRIVLPEGHDPRVIEAAVRVEREGLASTIVLGNPEHVRLTAALAGISTTSLLVVDPRESELLPDMAALYEELRAHRGITREDAEERRHDPILFGAFLVSSGIADGCVAGVATQTSDVLRAALHTVGVAAGAGVVSSSFLMVVPDDVDVPEHVLLFADCAVLPRPGRRQLAEIAAATAATRKLLVDDEPRVAMLSFSTKGSGVSDLATSRAGPTSLSSPISTRPTSPTSSSSGSAGRARSGRSSRASPSR